MSSSTSSVITNCEYWIRVNLALEYCLKEGLINILHNSNSDPSYRGLPNNSTQLFHRMQQCQQNRNHSLHNVLRKEQWDILCPANQQTNPYNWDITLLVAVIRSELKLQPLGGWKIKTLNGNDRSIGAFVFLIRNLRNEINHGSIDDIDTLAKFTTYWNRIENILIRINYGNMQLFYDLKANPLDKHVTLIHKTVGQLKVDVNNLKKEAADNSKEIGVLQKNIGGINTFLSNLERDLRSKYAC